MIAHGIEVAHRVHGAPPAVDSSPRYVGLITRAIAWVIDAAIVNGVAVITGAAASGCVAQRAPAAGRGLRRMHGCWP